MNQPTDTPTLIEIFDPAMCCSTGVCGPDVDDTLADFAQDAKWLKSQGVNVKRYNLGQEPEVFKSNPKVLERLRRQGSDILPLILINGDLVSEGSYPDRKQLTDWLGITPQTETNGEVSSKSKDILNALEAAITDGDENTLRSLFEQGKESGIPVEELVNSMQQGINTRQRITQSTLQSANELLGVSSSGCAPGSGCC